MLILEINIRIVEELISFPVEATTETGPVSGELRSEELAPECDPRHTGQWSPG